MTLVIDFGTVNTVGIADGRLVTVDGAPWLPSVVHSGVVGADATHLGRGREIRDLKARLTPAAVEAVFGRMLAAARAQGHAVDDVVVTHPAGWPPDRVAVLARATHAATVRTMPEPVAAACAVPPGETALVVDAGGGTWDVAVVRDHAVMASASALVDVDQRIVERVRPSLTTPVTSDETRAALLESARIGKELLSRHDLAEIVLPDHRAVRLTRAEFEVLIAPDVNRLMGMVSEVTAGLPVGRVLLAGGASRIPLLPLRLTATTGWPVVADPEPETAVARGADVLASRSGSTAVVGPPPGVGQRGAAQPGPGPTGGGQPSPEAKGTGRSADGPSQSTPGPSRQAPGAGQPGPGAGGSAGGVSRRVSGGAQPDAGAGQSDPGVSGSARGASQPAPGPNEPPLDESRLTSSVSQSAPGVSRPADQAPPAG